MCGAWPVITASLRVWRKLSSRIEWCQHSGETRNWDAHARWAWYAWFQLSGAAGGFQLMRCGIEREVAAMATLCSYFRRRAGLISEPWLASHVTMRITPHRIDSHSLMQFQRDTDGGHLGTSFTDMVMYRLWQPLSQKGQWYRDKAFKLSHHIPADEMALQIKTTTLSWVSLKETALVSKEWDAVYSRGEIMREHDPGTSQSSRNMVFHRRSGLKQQNQQL